MGIFCEHPEEGPIQKEDGLWYCIAGGVGWGDKSFVKCKGDPRTCLTLAAIYANHLLSRDNINFPSHLPGTRGSAEADDVGNVFLIKPIR